MPFMSKAQARWAHTRAGTKSLGGKDKVKEWEAGTDFDNLPARKTKASKKPKSVARIRNTTRQR